MVDPKEKNPNDLDVATETADEAAETEATEETGEVKTAGDLAEEDEKDPEGE